MEQGKRYNVTGQWAQRVCVYRVRVESVTAQTVRVAHLTCDGGLVGYGTWLRSRINNWTWTETN
jgi:hypothetical protein